MWSPLLRVLMRERRPFLLWLLSAFSLAISSAAITFLVGPILRVIFGGESLTWSPWMRSAFGTPPPLTTVKWALPWLIALTASIKALSFYYERTVRAMLVRRVGRYLRSSVLEWGLAQNLDQSLSYGQGELCHRLTVDVERVERWLDNGGASLLRDSLTSLSLIVSMLLLSGYLGLVTLLIYPLLIIPILSINKKLKHAARGDISTAHELHRWSQYAEAHISLVKANRRATELERDLESYHQLLERSQSKLASLQGFAPSLTELLVSLLIASSLYGFTLGLDKGWWSAEELLSLFVCILMLYQPIKSLSRAQQQWTQGLTALERCDISVNSKARCIEKEISLELSEKDSKLGQFQPLHRVELTINGLKRGKTDLSLSIEQGVSVGGYLAITGENGTGKSSLLYAVTELIEWDGQILFFDRDDSPLTKNQLDIHWLGTPCRVLLSDLASLFSHSSEVKENNARKLLFNFGFPERLLTQLRSSDPIALWDWFERLSQGERQKIGLSITLTRCSHGALILLDEPEAHLDQKSLQRLVIELQEIARQNIVIISTHDRSLIDAASTFLKLKTHLQVHSVQSNSPC